MATAPSNVKRQLCTVIKRFKFEELETAVIPSFPEISWTDLKSRLIKLHGSFKVSNAVRVIESAIEDAHLQEKELRDRLSTLEVIDVSRHNNRRVWYGYVLKGPETPVNVFTNRKVQKDIKEMFLTYKMEMDVKVVKYDGIQYVSVKEKPKRRTFQRTTPIFFALFFGQKHFFCSRKIVPPNVIKVITNVVGYNSSHRIKLMGRDLRSLIRLLWSKDQGALDASYISGPLEYKEADPVIKDTGVDYTQHLQRRSYAKKCFGENPPTLELVVINGPDQSWEDEDILEKVPQETIQIGWEFRSRNIAAFLSKLTEQRILVTPLPYYIENLMIIGRNELTLQND